MAVYEATAHLAGDEARAPEPEWLEETFAKLTLEWSSSDRSRLMSPQDEVVRARIREPLAAARRSSRVIARGT